MNALKTTAIICCIAGSLLIGWAIGFYNKPPEQCHFDKGECPNENCPAGNGNPNVMRAYQVEMNDLQVILYDGRRLVGYYNTDTAHLNQLDSIILKDNGGE